jgi:mono/diheme cytochrome c family protein
MNTKAFVDLQQTFTRVRPLSFCVAAMSGMTILGIATDAQLSSSATKLGIHTLRATQPAVLVPGGSTPAPGGLYEEAQPPAGKGGPSTPSQVFQAICQKCHDKNGKGQAGRDLLPEIPDFTDAKWQDSRSDAQLSRSILNGKGKSMRPMKDKLGTVDVKKMVAYIRAFRGGKQAVPGGSKGSPHETQTAARAEKADRLFQELCVKCHRKDGTGIAQEENLPAPPDFTDPAWQAKRGDPQLLASILDGKGKEMLPFRGRLHEEDARDLVEYVRMFSPNRARSGESTTTRFENRFRRLENRFRELERRVRELPPSK